MNIKKYYLYQFFHELMPIYPIYLLLFESRGLSLTQISFLLIIWSIPSLVLEIPAGLLGDRFSRKYLIALGGFLKAAGYLVWMFAEGFWAFAAGFILWGISGAFRSGAEEALLFDSLKLSGEEESFDRVLGRGRFFFGAGTIIASLIGGYIGSEFGFATALLISVITGLISAFIALSMKEVNLYKERMNQQEEEEKTDTLGEALRFLFGHYEILLFSLLALLVLLTAGVLDEYDQLVAQEFGLSYTLIGTWAAIRFVLMAFGGYLAGGLRKVTEKLLRVKQRIYVLGILSSVAAACLIVSGTVKHIGIMILYGLFYLIMAGADVLKEDYVQQKIELEGRSTVHSIISLSESLYGIVFYGVFGFLLDRTDLFTGLVLCGVYIIIAVLLLCGLYHRYNRKESKQMA